MKITTKKELIEDVATMLEEAMYLLDEGISAFGVRFGVKASHVFRWVSRRNLPRDPEIIKFAQMVTEDRNLLMAKKRYEKLKEKYKKS